MDERERAFFEDLAGTIDRTTADVARALRNPESPQWEAQEELATLRTALTSPEQRRALETVVNEALRVLTHSILVTLDGGTEYADTYGTPQVLDREGRPFGDALHELFVDHLVESGRLR
jgi:hypothetical protein